MAIDDKTLSQALARVVRGVRGVQDIYPTGDRPVAVGYHEGGLTVRTRIGVDVRASTPAVAREVADALAARARALTGAAPAVRVEVCRVG